jgi:hypothetical protein
MSHERSQWRRGGSNWSPKGSVEQWSPIRIILMKSRIRILICIKAKKLDPDSESALKWKAGSGSDFRGCGSATLEKSRLKSPVRVNFYKMPATCIQFLKNIYKIWTYFLVQHAIMVRLLGTWACMTSTWPSSGYNRISLLSGMNRI